MIIRPITYYFHQSISTKFIAIILLEGIILGFYGQARAAQTELSPTWANVILMALIGPNLTAPIFTDIGFWLVFYASYLYIIANVAPQIWMHYPSIIFQIGSRQRWWLGIVLYELLAAILYLTLILAGISFSFFLQHGSITFDAVQGLNAKSTSIEVFCLSVYGLFSLALLSVGLLHSYLAILYEHTQISLAIIGGALMLFALMGSIIPQSIIYLFPTAHFSLGWHQEFDEQIPLSLIESIGYNFIVSIAIGSIGLRYLKRADIL